MQYGSQIDTQFSKALEEAVDGLKAIVKESGEGSLYAMLSPMIACEEAWLLGQYIRSLDPKAVLALGPVPTTGQNEDFKHYLSGKTMFTIQGEKVPNAKGIRRVIEILGGATATFEELVANAKPELKKLKGGWIVGGYLSSWVPADAKQQPAVFGRMFKVVQDILPSTLADKADVLLPAAAWAEKDGCWENYAGKIQPFAAAIAPPEGARREGDVYYKLLGRAGTYNAQDVRAEMGEPFTSVALPTERAAEPEYEFVEL
jgi:NADH-quinone oxidoreductase subunit G